MSGEGKRININKTISICKIAIIVLIVVGMLTTMLTFSGCAKSEVSPTPSEGHKELHDAEDVHHEVAHKPWWRIRGFEALFAVGGCIYYILVILVLPRLIQRRSGGA